MKTAEEAYAKLVRCVNIRHYIGVNGADLIKNACSALTEEEKGRPPNAPIQVEAPKKKKTFMPKAKD
jgi:hypothetical protein